MYFVIFGEMEIKYDKIGKMEFLNKIFSQGWNDNLENLKTKGWIAILIILIISIGAFFAGKFLENTILSQWEVTFIVFLELFLFLIFIIFESEFKFLLKYDKFKIHKWFQKHKEDKTIRYGLLIFLKRVFVAVFYAILFYCFFQIISFVFVEYVHHYYIFHEMRNLDFLEKIQNEIVVVLGLIFFKNIGYLHKRIFSRFDFFGLVFILFIVLNNFNFYLKEIFIQGLYFYLIFSVLSIFIRMNINQFKEKENSQLLINALDKFFRQSVKELNLEKQKITDKNQLLEIEKYDYEILYNEVFKKRDIKENYIDLALDRPLDSAIDEEDILGHAKIAQNIFELIRGLKLDTLKTSYSIGIVGEWGIGKSGIVNILKNDWMKGRGDMIFYEFNPWNFDKKDLVEKFFEDLSRELDISNLGRLFKQYSNLISSVEKTGILSGVLSLLLPEKSLHELKEEINNKLIENGKKVVISIDDLDRCEPEEVMMMLNLIKNLGGFQNLIYVVSYDKENVLKVLDKKNFGENYLDKIINTEIFVSEPTQEQLTQYYENGILQIFRGMYKNFIDKNISDEDLGKTELEFIFEKLFYQDIEKDDLYEIYIKRELDGIFNNFYKENLRFLKKFLNNFNLILNSIYSDIEKRKVFINYMNQGVKYKTTFGGKSFLYVLKFLFFVKIKSYNLFLIILEHREYIKNNDIGLSLSTKNNVIYEIPQILKYKSLESFTIKNILEICGINVNEKNSSYISKDYNYKEISNILDNFII